MGGGCCQHGRIQWRGGGMLELYTGVYKGGHCTQRGRDRKGLIIMIFLSFLFLKIGQLGSGRGGGLHITGVHTKGLGG